jgi:hypothetical protein
MMNAAITLVIVALLGVLAWQGLQPKPQAPAQPAPLTSFDTCYTDDAVRKLYGVVADGGDMPQSWHRQIVAMLASTAVTVTAVPDDIKALPELAGYNKLLPLREAMAREREQGGDRLFRAVRDFSTQKFDALLRPDNAARQQVREILWLWMGVDEVNPKGRGPFIDGRDIAMLEKVFGEKFLQLRRYPDPVAVAAAGLKEAVNMLVDHYYSRLLWQSAGHQLFVKSSVARARGEPYLLDEITLGYISARAAALPDDDKRLFYWDNVLYALPAYRPAGVSPANEALLDKAIKASSPALSFASVKKHTEARFSRNFWDEEGRALHLLIIYSDSMNVRKTCYAWKADSWPHAAVRNLP